MEPGAALILPTAAMKGLSVIQVQLGDRSYPIHIGGGAWEILTERFLGDKGPGKIMLVTDEKVHSLYSGEIGSMVKGSNRPAELHVIPEGESSKSFQRLEDLCRALARSGLDRDSLLVSLGGGVVGDLAGLAASLYLRGIKVVQVPTTLLAMVDSSTGGKTGINLPEGKNQVGTFYQPVAVIADTNVLGTLEPKDWYSGMAEVLKIALTLDPDLFDYLEGVIDLGPEGDVDRQLIVDTACRRKAEVVTMDEMESGPRLVLNFGHTLGHALESTMNYGGIRHGEAVAVGMRAALSLSRKMAGLQEDTFRRAMKLVSRIPVPEVRVDRDFQEFLARDKKRAGGRIRCILLEDIGRCSTVFLDDPGELVRAFESP